VTRSEFALRVGAPESSVRLWGEPGGLLHGRPYGQYTEADAKVATCYIHLRSLLGEKASTAMELAMQLRPHILASAGGRLVVEVEREGVPVKMVLDLDLLSEYVAA
jgi:hypothetical protein